jgi:N-acylglucosamine-6-phosphate 2-epimerase
MKENKYSLNSHNQRQSVLDGLASRLVASCQPVRGGALDRPDLVAALAQACIDGGAGGLRIEGIEDLKAVSKQVRVPIIGIIKRDLPDSAICITPYLEDVTALAQAGAQVIAVDATLRARPVEIQELLEAIHQSGCIAMADCSTHEEAINAHQLGFEIIGTTLSGYTGGEIPEEPDWLLLERCVKSGFRVMAEGRYSTPAHARKAIELGAWSVTVGTSLTRLEKITASFVAAIDLARQDPTGVA